MPTTLSVLAPVFAQLALGYAAARTNLLDDAGIRGVMKVVGCFAVPALLFRALTRDVGGGIAPPEVAVVYFLGCAGLLPVAYVYARRMLRLGLAECAIFGMGVVYSNSSLIGVPIVNALFGERGVILITQIIAVHSLILIPLATILVAIGMDGERMRIREVLTAALNNPMTIALAAGFAWRETGFALPPEVDQVAGALAGAASPMALIALGALVAHLQWPERFSAPIAATILKLVVHPLLTWLLARAAGLPQEAIAVATITAALPPGVNVYVMAAQFGRYSEESACAFAVATTASIITVALVVQALA